MLIALLCAALIRATMVHTHLLNLATALIGKLFNDILYTPDIICSLGPSSLFVPLLHTALHKILLN